MHVRAVLNYLLMVMHLDVNSERQIDLTDRICYVAVSQAEKTSFI